MASEDQGASGFHSPALAQLAQHLSQHRPTSSHSGQSFTLPPAKQTVQFQPGLAQNYLLATLGSTLSASNQLIAKQARAEAALQNAQAIPGAPALALAVEKMAARDLPPSKSKDTTCRATPYGKSSRDAKSQQQQVAQQPTDQQSTAQQQTLLEQQSVVPHSFEDIAMVETFLALHCVQEHAKQALRSLPPEGQRIVVTRGSLEDATNQTAVLMSRIEQAQLALRGELNPTTIKNFSAGDWICPACMDHQFQRNAICKRCGTPNPNPTFRARGRYTAPLRAEDFNTGPRTSEDIQSVDEFLTNSEVQEHAAQQLRELPVALQRIVVGKGSLTDARDPTAVLISRISHAKHAAFGLLDTGKVLSNQDPQDGDWYCPSCKDLQFRRNNTCRRCGTPNPGPTASVQPHQLIAQQVAQDAITQQVTQEAIAQQMAQRLSQETLAQQLAQEALVQQLSPEALAAAGGADGLLGDTAAADDVSSAAEEVARRSEFDQMLLQQHLAHLPQHMQTQALAAHAQALQAQDGLQALQQVLGRSSSAGAGLAGSSATNVVKLAGLGELPPLPSTGTAKLGEQPGTGIAKLGELPSTSTAKLGDLPGTTAAKLGDLSKD